jgi:hypothetical protein
VAEPQTSLSDLAVLTVTLLPGGTREQLSEPSETMAKVKFVLDGLGDQKSCTVAAREMGIPRRLEWSKLRGRGDYSFCLPADLTEWLHESVDEITKSGCVLWLHLIKPYGYLGMFPWERLLEPVLPCAILRLPDFVVDPPLQTPSVIDIALCCQFGGGNLSANVELLVDTAKALSNSSEMQQVRVIAFGDAEIRKALSRSNAAKSLSAFSFREIDPGESALATYIFNPIASLGNPIRAWLAGLGSGGRGTGTGLPSSKDLLAAAVDPVKSPWLRAVRKALGGQSVDVVHILTNAMLSLESGVLLLDQSDINTKSPSAHAVSAEEFLAFQAQVGAWAVGVSSPPDTFSDMGLRQFADSLAQLRPGPLLYHDVASDPSCGQLRDAFAFLLSKSPTTPHQSSATFAYCEPFRVFDDRVPDGTLESLSRRYTQGEATFQSSADVRSAFQTLENVPAWAAASERFVDLYKKQLAELSSKVGTGASSMDLNEIRSTLSRLQATVARVVKDQGS